MSRAEDLPFDPSRFSGKVPLFPLPDAVLLPGQEMKLCVFELRYRAMIQTALTGELLVGMALLKPGWEPHYLESPDIYPVICVGWIRSHERLDDGRFNLVLTGQERAKVESETQKIPYRVAEVTLLKDEDPHSADVEKDRKWLIQWIEKRLPPDSSLKDLFRNRWSKLPLGRLADAVSASLKVTPAVKYSLLEATAVNERIQRLRPLLKGMKMTSDVWKKP
ncbi:MAG: LON peptidase substrate-binding domain-containing protein [Candidatus Omnitrophica bacterium]|nr:LON peptidase substrate-binding domain-containing protein [Candidatus Omnitrophota bacterium]